MWARTNRSVAGTPTTLPPPFFSLTSSRMKGNNNKNNKTSSRLVPESRLLRSGRRADVNGRRPLVLSPAAAVGATGWLRSRLPPGLVPDPLACGTGPAVGDLGLPELAVTCVGGAMVGVAGLLLEDSLSSRTTWTAGGDGVDEVLAAARLGVGRAGTNVGALEPGLRTLTTMPGGPAEPDAGKPSPALIFPRFLSKGRARDTARVALPTTNHALQGCDTWCATRGRPVGPTSGETESAELGSRYGQNRYK